MAPVAARFGYYQIFFFFLKERGKAGDFIFAIGFITGSSNTYQNFAASGFVDIAEKTG